MTPTTAGVDIATDSRALIAGESRTSRHTDSTIASMCDSTGVDWIRSDRTCHAELIHRTSMSTTPKDQSAINQMPESPLGVESAAELFGGLLRAASCAPGCTIGSCDATKPAVTDPAARARFEMAMPKNYDSIDLNDFLPN